MATSATENRLAGRVKLVEEHVRQENLHDLAATMATFGNTARFDDELWDAHFEGHNAVRTFYETMLAALPDLHIDVTKRYVADEVIILECIIRGTHVGPWRGLPGTGHRLEFQLCTIYSFDEQDKLAGERIYYDRATVLRQLGVFREPEPPLGRLLTLLTHPLTMACVAGRKLVGR